MSFNTPDYSRSGAPFSRPSAGSGRPPNEIPRLAPDLEEYLAFKKAMGFYGASRIVYLKQFDAYCTPARPELLRSRHRRRVGHRPAATLRKVPVVDAPTFVTSDGGCNAHGHPDAYVLSDQWKARSCVHAPTCSHSEEIEGFFTAASHRVDAHSPWPWQSIAFFTLMHSADFEPVKPAIFAPDNVVSDVWAPRYRQRPKAARSRRLPLTDDIVAILAYCDTHLAAHMWICDRPSLSPRPGHQSAPASRGVIFNRIWDQAGLPRPVSGSSRAPMTSGITSPTPTSNAG